jgi:hypothetical protein
MQRLIDFLKVFFSPITIIVKFIKEDDTGVLAFLCIVIWVFATVFTWAFVATTASVIFQVITFLAGYGLTWLFYHKIDGLGSDDSISMFLFFLIIAAIAGYTLGLAGHAFFLLY